MVETKEKSTTSAEKPAEKSASKSANKTTSKTIAKSSTKTTDKPTVKSASKSVSNAKVARKKITKVISSKKRPYRKSRLGSVVSDKMDKTIVVEIEQRSKHPLYGKVVKKFKKFKAHDEENTANIGDVVRIVETRPLSATKHWRLAEIVERSK